MLTPNHLLADWSYVIELGRTERDALGIIPAPSILARQIRTGHYVLVRDGSHHRRGYILHGPPHAGLPLHIYQTCVEPDYRLREYARRAVDVIAERGRSAGATEIRLRCAADLPAVRFWTAIGFHFNGYTIGGTQRARVIAQFALPLAHAPSSRLLFAPGTF